MKAHSGHRWLRLAGTSLLLGGLTLGVASQVGAMQQKIYICHAAGLEGTTQYVTLHLPPEAVYGQAGHFYENGTPRAGHEQDYLGKCHEEPSDTTVPEDTTPDTTVPETTADTTPETTAATTTSTSVAVDDPPVPTTQPAELPTTGSTVNGLMAAGLALVAAGTSLRIAARRRA